MEGKLLCTEFPRFPDSAELHSSAAPVKLFQGDVGGWHTHGTNLLSFKLVEKVLSKVPCPMACLCWPCWSCSANIKLNLSPGSTGSPYHSRTLPLLTPEGRLTHLEEHTSVSLCFSAPRSCLCQKPGGIRVAGSWEQTCSPGHGFKGQNHGRNTGSPRSDPKLPSVVKLCHLDSRK